MGTAVKRRHFVNLAGKKKKRKKVKLTDNKSIKYRDKICLHEAAERSVLHAQRYGRGRRKWMGKWIDRLLSAPVTGVDNVRYETQTSRFLRHEQKKNHFVEFITIVNTFFKNVILAS